MHLRVLNNQKEPIGDNTFNLGSITLNPPVPILGVNTLSLDGIDIDYDLWLQDQPAEDFPLYRERATITLVTQTAI